MVRDPHSTTQSLPSVRFRVSKRIFLLEETFSYCWGKVEETEARTKVNAFRDTLPSLLASKPGSEGGGGQSRSVDWRGEKLLTSTQSTREASPRKYCGTRGSEEKQGKGEKAY